MRQTKGNLIEILPSNALYILQINDNKDFVKSSALFLPVFNSLLYLDALSGFEFFIDQMPVSGEPTPVLISCYPKDNKPVLLFTSRAHEITFRSLLKSLKIDARNFIPFGNEKIYAYGVNYHKYYFCLYNKVFLVSEDIELLKKSIVQQKYPRTLLSDKSFAHLYQEIITKNNKQNWLIVNHELFLDALLPKINQSFQPVFFHLKELSSWSAFLIDDHEGDLVLSGYTLAQSTWLQVFTQNIDKESFTIPTHLFPANTLFFTTMKLSDPEQFARCHPVTDAVVAQDFLSLQPRVSGLFGIQTDSVIQYYGFLLADSLHPLPVPEAIDSMEVISPRKNTFANDIISINRNVFSRVLLSSLPVPPFHYALPEKNYYILADSVSALEKYRIVMQQGALSTRALNKFVQAAIPSSSRYDFCIFPTENFPLFPDIHTCSITLCVLSFSPPERGVLPVNIRLKMLQR